jgi:hypothetical protein
MKKIKFLTFMMFIFFVSEVSSQSLLYSNVGVSDGGTTNSIGEANTSRNVDVDINGNIGVVYVGSDGLRFAKSIDRGQSFLPTVLLKNVNVGNCEVNMADNKTIYVVYSNGSQISLFVSLDEGSTFSSEIIVGVGSTPHIASYGSSIFIVTQDGSKVYRNSNNGQGTFTTLSTPGSWVYADIRTDRSNGDVYLIADNPSLFMYRSTDNCDTWVNQGITGSVYYSSYSLTTNAIGNYVYTAGSGSNGYKITFGGGSATAAAVSVGNNAVSTGRTLASDSFGNFVDGYSASASQLKIGVSNDFAVTFPNTLTIDNATSQNVVINPKFQDIVCTYRGTDGKIYLNVYQDFISGLTISNVSNGYCVGSTSAISYNSAKSIFNSGNQFIVQLSDQNRSFTSPIVIGSITSVVNSGSIPITIPSSVLPGNEYRIRVISTDNSFVGADNGFDIAIPSSIKVSGRGGVRYLDQAGQLVIDPSTLDNGSSGCTNLTFSASPTTFNCTNLGANNVVFTAKDESGKDASVSVVITVQDNLSPIIVSNGDKNATTDLDACGATVVVSATATDNCTVGVPTGVRSDALALDAAYPVGTTTIAWNVTDANSNAAVEVTQTIVVTDNQLPVIVSNGDTNATTDLDACGATVVVSATATDNCTVGVPTGVRSDALALDALYPVGTTTIAWNVADANSNDAIEVIQTIVVTDSQNPIAITKNITVQLDATGNVSILAADVNNGSSDACGISLLELDKTSFTCANVGGNTVTLKATDVNGNVTTQTAIVTVEDKVAPVVVTKNSTIQLNAAGTASIVVADVNNGSTDNCGISLVELDKMAFTCANVGANTVTLKVTDNNGNIATQTAIITVEDKTAPVVVTKNTAIQLNATGTASVVAADINNGSTDACGISLLELDKSTFTCANIGLNTVTLKVTDVNGNVTSKTAVVAVEDKMAPVVVAKNKTIQLNAAGTASIVVADVNNGSTDNCGISLVELDKMAFTCANVGANTVTLKVTDNNGNVATQTAIITVEDKIAPVVITKNITVQLDASSNILIAAADINNGSTDNCGISLLELDKALFSCADLGENVVTLKVTDNSGNVTTRTAIVTIVNSQPNLIRKHFDDVIFFDNSSKAFIAYSWYKNGVLVSSQTTQYFKDSGVLNGTYYAKATKIDGTVVTTCPLTFSASIVDEYLKIAPNPVKSNASYQILTNVDSAKLQNARITVFNILGALLNDKMVDGKTTDMIAPSAEGIYIVKMTLANGKYFTKNLLVKN